jgi:hypothetical protein
MAIDTTRIYDWAGLLGFLFIVSVFEIIPRHKRYRLYLLKQFVMNKALCLIFLWMMLCNSNILFAQGKIEKSKSEISKNSTTSSTTTTTSTQANQSQNRSNYTTYSDNLFVNLFVGLSWGIVKYVAIGDYYKENHLYHELSIHPYYDANEGNYSNKDTSLVYRRQLRFDVSNHFLYESSQLYGNHFELKVRPFEYFYFQTDYIYLREKVAQANISDDLSLIYLQFAYDRFRYEKFNLGWSIGASYLASGVNQMGFAVGFQASYFADNNISFHSRYQMSWINQKPVHFFQIQGRKHFGPYFISTGYEQLKIATPIYHMIQLGGGIYF